MAEIRKTERPGDAREKLLLQKALQAFHDTTGIGAKAVVHEPRLPNGRRADARVTFDAPLPVYLAEIKGEMTPARLGPVIAQLRELPPPRLLVARYVTAPLAERLRVEGIQFLDTAGNAYLYKEKPRYHIFVTGRKPEALEPAERPIKAFRAAGLRVLFPLLCVPGAVNAPYRKVADIAGVALGTVAQTMAELKRIGLLRETRTGRTLEDRRRCIDTWVDTYPRELRPRLKPRRFRIENPDWWKKKDLTPLAMWLGGEAGAALLTKHLRPEVVTVYGTEQFTTLARDIRPAKDPHGNLEVLEAFWHFEPPQILRDYRLVPPLLIYADLIATADARNLETAVIIREKYLEA